MESLTKIELTRANLEHVVDHAFGPSVTLLGSEELKDGWFNTIHALELSDGRKVVLKVAPKPEVPVLRYEKDLLATEVTVLNLLGSRMGIPVPRVLFHAQDGAPLGQEWFVMEHISLPTYAKVKESLSHRDRAKAERSLGRVNRLVNTHEGSAFGAILPGGRRSSRWSEIVGFLVKDLLADARDRALDLPRSDAAMVRLVESRQAALDLVTVPRLVHWDLHDGNAFLGNDGTVAGIIDADRALWGDPLMEVYFSGLFDRTSFVEGYGTDILESEGAAERRKVYNLYLALVMVVECSFRNFTDPGHLAWTAAQLETALTALET